MNTRIIKRIRFSAILAATAAALCAVSTMAASLEGLHGIAGSQGKNPQALVSPVGVPVYTVTPINAVTGLRVSRSGDVVGWTVENGPAEPMLYTSENGVIVLPTSNSQPYGVARDLSERSSGVITVVGEARLDTTGAAIHAVRWRVAVPKGEVIGLTDLGVLKGHSESFATSVNSAGQIAGTSDPNSFLSIRSYIYSDAGGMVDLGIASTGQNAVARDLNDLGVVTGYLGLQAFRWSEMGGLQRLGVPAGSSDSFGYAINAVGQVAGTAGSASGNAEVIVRYTDGPGWQVLGGAGQHNDGSGINRWGDVVGTGIAVAGLRRGVIYTDNLHFLAFVDDLLLIPGSWTIMAAFDINDAQQITGWGIDHRTGQSSAVLLTPVSPPPVNQPPVAAFTYSCTPSLFCSFDGSRSKDDRGIVAWLWTADGQPIGVLPQKFIGVQFSAPQTIKLTLTVTDTGGLTDAMTQEVVIGGAISPPVLQRAASRKVHGGRGAFDLPLSLGLGNPTIEPRQGPVQTIVFTFDKAINAATIALVAGTAKAGAPTFSGNDVIVGLSGVADQQWVTVMLSNVASTDGGYGGSGSVRIGFLVGDVNQSRTVTVSDIGLLKFRLAQPVTAVNYLMDVDASGTLTVADQSITNANMAKSLSAP